MPLPTLLPLELHRQQDPMHFCGKTQWNSYVAQKLEQRDVLRPLSCDVESAAGGLEASARSSVWTEVKLALACAKTLALSACLSASILTRLSSS